MTSFAIIAPIIVPKAALTASTRAEKIQIASDSASGKRRNIGMTARVETANGQTSLGLGRFKAAAMSSVVNATIAAKGRMRTTEKSMWKDYRSEWPLSTP